MRPRRLRNSRCTILVPFIFLLLNTSIIGSCSNQPDQTSSIQIGIPNLTVLRTLSSQTQDSDGVLIKPTACAFASSGTLYILDEGISQILVLNENFEITSVFGGLGSGPGELPPGPKHLAVGRDNVLVFGQNMVHLFTLNGEFLTRFPISQMISDITIGHDGSIIAAVTTEDVQIIGWDHEGTEVLRRGEPFLKVTRSMMGEHPGYMRTIQSRVEALSDNTLAVYSPLWLRIRFYNSDGIEEYPIDLRSLPTPEDYEDLYDRIMTEQQRHPLEDASEKLAAGNLTTDDLPKYPIGIPSLSYSDNGDLWFANEGVLFQISRDGTLSKCCEFYRVSEGRCVAVAVLGDRIALCFTDDWSGNGIAIGSMRFSEPD